MDLDAVRSAYAETVIRSGINVAEGQPVLIRAETVQADFARALAREAYRAGARAVLLRYSDPVAARIRLDEARDPDYLDFVPDYTQAFYDNVIDGNWASISLRGPEDPDVFEGADSGRLSRMQKATRRAASDFLSAVSANRISWNVCLSPTRPWAEKVLGDDAGDNWEERIWELLVPILRLDADDPAGAWLEHDAELKRRGAHMNGARYDGVRFRGPGTDLFVGLRPDRVFAGGRCRAADGRMFFPNLPTEEIFSTPDRARTSGRVACTRPVEVMGTQVEGAWFRFEDGAVVDFGADRNEETLAGYLDTDEGARYLGEVALVDVSSPIYRSGRIFYSILYDENAACHIALGNGYPDCIEGGTEMDRDGLREVGCNVSLVHTDFMIGSEEVSVWGVREDGGEEKVMENGSFIV
jgi:aminopeptidase